MDQMAQGALRRPPTASHLPVPAAPRINRDQLVVSSVSAQIANPVGRTSAYRVGHDGVPRVLPGTGGITLNWRIGDPCIGIAGDHVEPGVALHNNMREVVGPRNGPNLGLITYACVGNRATVASGPMAGRSGWVTGKHGGVDHVLADFPRDVLARLRIGDTIQITSVGLGMRLLDHPNVALFNCAPVLLSRWGMLSAGGRLRVPVTHRLPAHLMGSGLGRNTVARGDYDIQLADPAAMRRHRLDTLRFGDFVCIEDSDGRNGPSWHAGRRSVGVIVHGDSTVSGHGPGVCVLMTGSAREIEPFFDARANLAAVLGVREPQPPRPHRRLVEMDPRRRTCVPARN
jgi:hypothetical protein